MVPESSHHSVSSSALFDFAAERILPQLGTPPCYQSIPGHSLENRASSPAELLTDIDDGEHSERMIVVELFARHESPTPLTLYSN